MISRLVRCLSASLALFLWSVAVLGADPVQLLPDQPFGNQFGAYYFWEDADGARSSFAIYDTGASVSTRFWGDQLTDQILLEDLGVGPGAIPAEVEDGAMATGVTGGEIVGDISTPGQFSVVGLDDVTFDPVTFELDFDLSSAATIPDTRLFLGTETGSPLLPSIVGMTVHKKTADRPMGTESLVDMQGYVIDFVELFPDVFTPESYPDGLKVVLPDTQFGETGSLSLSDPPGGEELLGPFRIPLELVGESTQGSGQLTNEPNPVIRDVSVANGGAPITGLNALLDYGAQLTAMDLDLLETLVGSDPPDFTIDVQGASAAIPVDGWSLEELTVPLDTNGDGAADDTLTFLDPVVFGIPNLADLGIEVIFGMNFFNTAHQLLFSPCDPDGAAVTVTFYADSSLFELGQDEADALVLIDELGLLDAFPVGSLLPGNGLPSFALELPEPGFVKEIIDGPDRDDDGEIDRVVPVHDTHPSEFVVKITYTGPMPAMVVDEVPADWRVISCEPENQSDLVMHYPTGPARGHQPRATRIEWMPTESGSSLLCTIWLRRLDPHHFGPRKCGCLLINDGAAAVDSSTSAPLMDGDGNPLVSNRLFVAAVQDRNHDRQIDWSGNGDEDGDGLTDYEECELGTDPCREDTDHDHVPDGEDADPLDRQVQ